MAEERELADGIWHVRATADVPPSLEWLLDAVVRAQIPEAALLAGPVVYTLDERSVERYERRVLVPGVR